MTDRTALMQAMRDNLKANYRQQAKQQKSDDIIEFIKANWKLFTASRGEMLTAVQSLGSSGSFPYSVDGLCDTLGIPSNVYFKRSPVKDVGNAILDFPKTKLYEIFQKCKQAQEDNEYNACKYICLFVVAGKKSICITDFPIEYPSDDIICYLPATDDIHIFKAADAMYRLPHLFKHEENYD